MIVNSLFLAVAIVYCIDLSGLMHKLNKRIYSMLVGKIVPYNGWAIPVFGCSLCTTFWAILLLNLCNDVSFINSLFLASIMSYLTSYIKDIFLISRKYWDKLWNE